MEEIKHFFDTYKDAEEVNQTSDGFLFERKLDADAHAATLQDRTIETFKKSDLKTAKVVKLVAETPKTGKGKTDGKTTVEPPKVEPAKVEPAVDPEKTGDPANADKENKNETSEK